jgi:hypothetical protein
MIIDPTLRVLHLDGSGSGTCGDCMLKGWFSYVAGMVEGRQGGYVSVWDSVPMVAGKAIHAALETRYKAAPAGLPSTTNLTAALTASDAVWQGKEFREPLPGKEPEWRTSARCLELLAAYFNHWGEEDFVVREVEAPFSRRIGDLDGPGGKWAVLWQGRRDLTVVYRKSNGAEWVMDHKTSTDERSDQVRKWTRNRGQLGYVWSRGLKTGRRPEGFVMNILQWRKPLARAAKEGSKPRNEFDRVPIPVEDWMIDEWKAGVLADAQRIIDAYGAKCWPASGKDCAFCPFFNYCTLPPKDRETALERSGNLKPQTWSPLTESV